MVHIAPGPGLICLRLEFCMLYLSTALCGLAQSPTQFYNVSCPSHIGEASHRNKDVHKDCSRDHDDSFLGIVVTTVIP
ncbi:hypothetical protein GGR50DRAFT_230109 [Xylaria sp. CBS 124048]|nr:hypothetical protein GGR50DRAFT_230109 [Xylaria sp. CBS 124048]